MNDDSDYEVGYRKPPKKHQFKKGQSGNRKGRPKKKESSDDLWQRILNEELESKGTKITLKEGIIRTTIKHALKGKAAALKMVLDHIQQEEELDVFTPESDDERALMALMTRLERANIPEVEVEDELL